MQSIRGTVLLNLMAAMLWAGAVQAQETRLEPELVDRDFEVTIEMKGVNGESRSVVVGNLLESDMRVPVMQGTNVMMVVEIGAVVYKRNTSTMLRPVVKVRVLKPGQPAAAGEDESPAIEIVRCTRAIDWNAPERIVILETDQLSFSLTFRPLGPAKNGAAEE